MTQGARAEQVDAFQGGKGDVFLVSLKAGGVGMNLTAADVVILLDPWWNPAVEDQATSRAHRMGQERPVTVVRIVTEETIEEKVLALHAKKRQLFDDVVTDSDAGGTFDLEMLATLLA
ncbi:MAG: family helicase [Labilithrix sp.]|nr:family helicase [Labilithrix sp.]